MVAIKLLDIDARPLSFGKHNGITPNEILELDAHYIVWLYENIEPKVCSKDLYMLACDQDDDIGADGEYGVNGYYG